MIRGVTQICAAVLLALVTASCGLDGQFGFKKFGDDTYRRLDGTPEFEAGETVDWVFAFKQKLGRYNIGIVYQKKELVWVEVLSKVGRIDKDNRVVYGTIKDLPPGEYQIVLTDLQEDNKLIDKKDFIIYKKDDEDDAD
jgi:hypothetical protein